MTVGNRLRWWKDGYVSGMVQLAGLTLWGLFVAGKYLVSVYRRAPWLLHRVEPAIVMAVFGGLVFSGMFLILRPGARDGKASADRLPYRGALPLVILSGMLIALITHSVTECLVLAWVVLVAWATGRVVTRGVDVAGDGDSLSEFIGSAGIGLGLLISVITVLGYVGWLYRSLLYLLLAGITVLLWRPILAIVGQLWDLRDLRWRHAHPEPDGFHAVGISLLGALIAMSSISAMAPEVGYDALTYHLAASKTFAQQHRIVEIPEMTPSYWPSNGAVLYAFAQLLSGPKLAKLFHFGFALLLVGLTHALGNRHFAREVGVRGALLFSSLPLILWESGTAYTDLAMSFFSLLGIWFFLEGWQRSDSGDLYSMALSGIAFGASVGFKPFALVIMTSLAIGLVFESVRRGALSLKRSALLISTLFSVSALFSIHWYVRSYLYTGNPIFPLLNSLFRSPYWTGPDLLNLSMFGMGTKPLDLLMLPWNMTFFPERFMEVGTLGVLFLAFLPLLPFARTSSAAGLWFFLVCAGFLLYWIKTGQAARYLLPILPLVALAYAAAIVRFCRERLRSSRPLVFIVHAILVLGVVGQALLWFQLDDTRFPYKVVFGKESRMDYLARVMPSSKVWTYSNEHLDRNAVVLSVGNEFTFFSDRRAIPYGWFSAVFTARSPECALDLSAEHLTYRSLLRCGYTHVLIDRSSPYFTSGQFDHTLLTKDSFYNAYLQLDYAFGEVSLYKVRKL